MPGAPAVCLVMIVRNESAVIARCMAAVWPHVAEWCIVDTGSEDTTVADIYAFVAAADVLPKLGRLHSVPWKDFGHNRTEALALARTTTSAHWLLMVDAGDILHCQAPLSMFLQEGPAAYNIRVAFHAGQIRRVQVFARNEEWAYHGRRYEWPHLSTAGTVGTLPEDVYIEARPKDASTQCLHKYREDALALEEDLAEAPGNTRALFYAAQSWRDAQEYPRALALYKQHAASDGCAEECYVSCLNIVWLESRLEEALRYAWAAVDIQPRRVEAAVALFERCRRASLLLPQLYAMGAFLSPPTLPPATSLFVDHEAYAWKFADEFAQVALALGRPVLGLPVAAAPPEQQCRLQFMARQASECPDTALACTFADCFQAGARVYVHPVRPLFARPLQLLLAWLRRAGVCVAAASVDCSIQLCFLDADALLPDVPLIVVATEQPPAYTLRMLATYAAAEWVWCMDNVDYAFLAAHGCRRIKVLPLMFGTYYMPAFMCSPHPHRIDVLQFGTKTRRRDAVMAAVYALRPTAAMVYVDTVYDEQELSALLLATRVVIVPAQFADTLGTFGLHRLAFLMHFPEVAVVAEDAPASVYYKYILALSGQAQFVPYEQLAAAAVAAIDAIPPGVNVAMRSAASRLLDWNGMTPWTSVLT